MLMDNILVTIGIATYNGERFLAEALNSALNQTHNKLEIIIYNDASNDNTEIILNQFTDKRVKVITGTENKGVSFARQKIKECAKGEYLTWLDDDDTFELNRVESLLCFSIENNVDIVIDHYKFIDEQNKFLLNSHIPAHQTQDKNFTRLFERNFMPAHPLISKKCYTNIDYDISLRTSEDYDYWLKCSYAGYSFKQIAGCFLNYRVTKGSLSSDPEKSKQATKIILSKYQNEELIQLYKSRGLELYCNKLACLHYIFNKNYALAKLYAKSPWPTEQNSDLAFYKGTLHLNFGEYSDSFFELSRHLEKFPDSISGKNNMGVLLKRMGKEHRHLWLDAVSNFDGYKDAISNLNGIEKITWTQINKSKLR